jgi:hypothetical protein
MRELRIAKYRLSILTACFVATGAFAQESPTPIASPEEFASPAPTASPTAASRSVPLRFVPPPMEGTISLGIFDSNGKLLRVLHREAKIDIFTVEENSLSTTWDGKDDSGQDLPAGKYRARGYLVGKLKVEELEKVESIPSDASDRISVKLVTNPLTKDTRSEMELGIAFDSKGTFLKTMDDLPLATINDTPSIARVAIKKNGDKTAEVWQSDTSSTEHLRVSNIDKMMAFDCGFFDLK